MSTMVRKLWDNTFHLEGKFLRTCWQLFIPGKVTTEFFKGKQDRYPHPLRMFAIVMFFFLFMVNLTLKNRNSASSGRLLSMTTRANTEIGDTIVEEKHLSTYERMKYEVMFNDLRADYKKLPSSWQSETSHKAVDSLLRRLCEKQGIEYVGPLDSLETDNDTSNLVLFGSRRISVATQDLVRYEPEELIHRYQIHDWLMQLLVRQTIKSFKSPDAFVHAYTGSLTWTILALVALMSGILGLLYWRQKRYYVEHFIFLLHFHTGVMLAILLALLGIQLGFWGNSIYLWLMLGGSGFIYAALYRYYGQTWGKTLGKWLLFGILYYLCFFLLFTLGTIAVFAMY